MLMPYQGSDNTGTRAPDDHKDLEMLPFVTISAEAQKKPRNGETLQPTETSTLLESVALDPLKMEINQSSASYILTMVDHYTKFLVTTPLREITSRATTEAFRHYFDQPYGCPTKVLTDKGTPYKSQMFKELYCALYMAATS
ncbi:unnamed protein product [Caretta caretta]